jgi:hypothetical protein
MLLYEKRIRELKAAGKDFKKSPYLVDLAAILHAACMLHNTKTARQNISKGYRDKAPAEQKEYYNALYRVFEADSSLMPAQVLHGKWEQSVPVAKSVFSKQVQDKLESLGENKTAEFVEVMRGYWEASDQRGLSRADRVQRMQRTLAFFGMDPASNPNYLDGLYPPKMYTKGLPYQSVDGIVISAASYLLLDDKLDGLFHDRIFTTDIVESFFSRRAKRTHERQPRAHRNHACRFEGNTQAQVSLKFDKYNESFMKEQKGQRVSRTRAAATARTGARWMAARRQ